MQRLRALLLEHLNQQTLPNFHIFLQYESPSFLPGRHQDTPPAPEQRVDYTRIQGLSTSPSERLRDRVVMVRCDWNVDISVHESGRTVFTDDACLRASLPTIRHLAEAGARVVVVSQFGTPGKGQRLQLSLDLLAGQRNAFTLVDCAVFIGLDFVSQANMAYMWAVYGLDE
jgi:hypothetical protein